MAVLAAMMLVATLVASTPAVADGNEAPGAPAPARSITAAGDHTCAILDNGTVKCWGSGDSGRLGSGDTANRGDGPGEMGDNLPAVDLGSGRTATAITAGSSHTCALLDDGTVKCWGAGGSGRLGYGNSSNVGDMANQMGDDLAAVALGSGRTATAITAGGVHTCALLDDGTVKCWGFGSSGQLGYGNSSNVGDIANQMGNFLPAVALGSGRIAIAITAGSSHTCALLDDGTVKCWGRGISGRLGYGNTSSLGDAPGEMGDNLAAVDLGSGRTAIAITAGTSHTCAPLDDGTVKCWGRGAGGRLGSGDTANLGDAPGEMGDNLAAVALGSGRTALAVTIGATHSCAVLDNATVKCWGRGGSGRLGYGNTANRGDRANQMGDSLPAVNLGAPTRITDAPSLPPRRCAGRVVTVDLALGQVPTDGDDVIIGTPGDDIINGLGGNNIICGGGGDDILIGGPGDDILIGGPGNDILIGGPGNDILRGGPGNDILRGGPGNDILRGGPGNDRLFGGGGRDRLFGGRGNDRLDGGPGNDTCRGGPGTNTLRRC